MMAPSAGPVGHYAVNPPGSPRPRGHAGRLAVFVTHGMGQQVPFATVDDPVAALMKHPALAKVKPHPEVVQLGDQMLQRVRSPPRTASPSRSPDRSPARSGPS